jgi:hypothetical protein
METTIVIIVGAAAILALPFVTWLDIAYEKREIDRFLRLGGCRILRFRWKPFVGFLAMDKKSKHYEIDFEEQNGRRVRAIFTFTTRLGVMMTERRELG